MPIYYRNNSTSYIPYIFVSNPFGKFTVTFTFNTLSCVSLLRKDLNISLKCKTINFTYFLDNVPREYVESTCNKLELERIAILKFFAPEFFDIYNFVRDTSLKSGKFN